MNLSNRNKKNTPRGQQTSYYVYYSLKVSSRGFEFAVYEPT